MRKIIFLLTLFLVNLISADVPSPPEILNIICKSELAILYWTPTGDEQPSSYSIQYETNFNPDQWIDYKFIELRDKEARLLLSPWTNYTFRVIAKNKFGESQPSLPSNVCATVESVPHMNPQDVYGRGNGPHNLLISWKSMAPIDHNAPGFYYNVSYRQEDDHEAKWHVRVINKWETNKILVEQLPKLKPYRIKVEAYNSRGKANVDAQEVIGYSDEDIPSAAPRHFQVTKIVDGRSAFVSWDRVDPKTLNGQFKGYKIRTWTDTKEDTKEAPRHAIINSNKTNALINIFKPGTKNFAVILVFNGAHDGPASQQIELIMPENVIPDPPSLSWKFGVEENEKPVIIVWMRPNVTNNNQGKVYYIKYRVQNNQTSQQWEMTPKEPIVNSFENMIGPNDLIGLEYNTIYEIQVVAKFGEFETPSPIVVAKIGPKAPPTQKTTPTPKVHHQAPPVEQQFESLTQGSVQNGERPELINIVNDHVTDRSLVIDEPTPDPKNFASTPWFIALLCVLAFIAAFVGIFIFIKRRKGSATINRKGTEHTDKIRNVQITNNPIDPEHGENRHMMTTIDNHNRNSNRDSLGHDEGDADNDDDVQVNGPNNVYRETTKKV